jgi:hypothetical protein
MSPLPGLPPPPLELLGSRAPLLVQALAVVLAAEA